jgi:hypothetical protein
MRKEVANKDDQGKLDLPKDQYITIEYAESAKPGVLELLIAETTFTNAEVGIFALEAADDIIMTGLRDTNHGVVYKRKQEEGENMGIKVRYQLRGNHFDRVSIVYSTFPCDALAISALRGAVQFIKHQLQEALRSNIIEVKGSLPGAGGRA